MARGSHACTCGGYSSNIKFIFQPSNFISVKLLFFHASDNDFYGFNLIEAIPLSTCNKVVFAITMY